MATKRPRDEFADETDGFNGGGCSGGGKRARISFAAVIREAMVAKSLQNLVVMLEPTLRRVIQEEVDKALRKTLHCFQLSSSGQLATPKQQLQQHGLQVSEADSPPAPAASSPRPTLRLAFETQPLKKIFTSTKIEDEEGKPLQLVLIDDSSSDGQLPRALPPTLKIELVVVDGDFPGSGKEDWTEEEFNRSVLRAREGRRPLLTGDANNVVMRDGRVTVEELIVTDNSSWIRSRKFRIGARVAPECCDAAGVRIKEALTEPFVVKDHRGELYKKSYPPSLSDEVWRLEKIGKDGKFHKRLADHGIQTVQEFLKLHAVDPARLRSIMGQGMSERMWESTVVHAKTCELGTKLYLHRDPNGATVLLNPVCGFEGAFVDGVRYAAGDTLYAPHRAYVDRLVADAYGRWEQLQEVERAALMPHDPMHVFFQQSLMLPPAMADNNLPPAVHTDIIVPSGYPHANALAANAAFDLDILGSLADTVQLDFGGAGAGAAYFQYPSFQTPMLQQPGNLYNTSELSSSDEGSSVSQQGYLQSRLR